MQESTRIAEPISTHGLTPAKHLVAEARARIENLTAEQLTHELQHEQIVLVDLREQAERDVHGAIPGAVHIPRGMLEFCADPTLPVHSEQLDPSSRIVLYCGVGSRSALAAVTLKAIGFPDVAHLDGGFEAWQRAGGSIEAPSGTEAACWVHLLQR
jgi:rhodanese-related sulfurtransferase